jgi:lysophospholipase L1-like esterase
VSVRVALAVALALCATACGRTAKSVVVPPEDPNIRYVGWFDTRTPRAPRFAWPGTQVTAQFTGTSLRVRLTDTPIEDDTREVDWITAVIDDQRPRTFALAEGPHVYPLATNLPNGPHRVVIWKRTESEVGVITFHGFELDPDGVLTTVSKVPQRRIVFIGDSITAGYGNEGSDPTCRWSATRENNYETYGAIAARQLGADYVAMAWSGKGLTRNYEARDRLTLPEIYDRVIPTENDSPRIPNVPADVVVVNIGTNDFFQGLPDEGAFRRSYLDLLRSLRQRFPTALFVLGLGPMLADDYPQPNARTLMRRWIEAARKARAESGDTKLEFTELWIDPTEGVGCDFHPSIKTHTRLGRELVDLLRARLRW